MNIKSTIEIKGSHLVIRGNDGDKTMSIIPFNNIEYINIVEDHDSFFMAIYMNSGNMVHFRCTGTDCDAILEEWTGINLNTAQHLI